ncbi:venom acid phosphatase Acph-1-like [Anthonomus grandis grandis]|uniref:venom acid phosphatase Acph-1-like n=1 Tax=Anthonomus grandis grandis TaxID=2921223 RepID=UPI0021663668|nr:venom acid phosphatase Acph-1-like [Anthonomus grandis grandis]
MKYLIGFGLIYVTFVTAQPISDKDSLRLISVFFRHGARTPEMKDTYPNDPYKLDTFQPMGWGQLTNNGKNMAFTLGRVLRNRYKKFLGEIYVPEFVRTQSTDYDRTKNSALLLLAGLFPPAKSQRWSEELDWQPIPIEYEKDREDHTLKRPNTYCPTYLKELEEVLQSDEILAYIKMHKSSFQYIANHTGKPINKLSDVFQIYQTLTAEATLNLTLPEWTNRVYPEEVTKIAAKQCEIENYNDVLKKLNGGRMLGKVIANMVAKTEGSLHPHERKIFLYSGHENNVINILAALDLFKTHFPKYSSAVMIELHYLRSRQDYAVKVLYIRDVYKPPEELTLENCDVLCPLNTFIKLTEKHVPKNYTAECESTINLD